MENKEDKGKHYRFQLKHMITADDEKRGFVLINLDPFKIAREYGMTSFALMTVLKKILCAGGRGHKNYIEDIDDSICALEREKQLLLEDESNK